jgi:hypothetical protein
VWIQESCQRFYERDWPAMLENPIAPESGFIRVPEESGFGMRIKPEAWNHPAAARQVSGRSSRGLLSAKKQQSRLCCSMPKHMISSMRRSINPHQ